MIKKMEKHEQYNDIPPIPNIPDLPFSDDWTSAPNIVRTDKDLCVKDFYNFTDNEANLNRGQKRRLVDFGAGDAPTYTIALADFMVGVSDVIISRTVKMPKPSIAGIGKIYIIKDMSGSALTTTITISPFASETIDGDTGTLLNTNFGVKRLFTDGTNWFSY